MKKKRQTLAWDSLHAYYRKRDLYLKQIQAKLVVMRIRSGFLGSFVLLLVNSLSEFSDNGMVVFRLSDNILWNISRIITLLVIFGLYLFYVVRVFLLNKEQSRFFKEEL